MDEQRQVSEAQKRAHRKYMEKFVEIKVRVTPEKRTIIQDHAQVMGESATTFINRAIDNQMIQDRATGPQQAPQAPPWAGAVSLPPDVLEAAQQAAERTGEAAAAFIARAVDTQAQRDKSSLCMGLNPATGEKLKGEA